MTDLFDDRNIVEGGYHGNNPPPPNGTFLSKGNGWSMRFQSNDNNQNMGFALSYELCKENN